MVTLNRETLPLLFAALILLMSYPARTTAQNGPIVVEVYKTARGTGYKVDSRTADLSQNGNLLRLLGVAYEKHGPNTPVVVLLDPHVSIEQIDFVDGVAAKVPLTYLRYFRFSRQTGKMTEIKFGPTLPYSTSPPLDQKSPSLPAANR